MNGWRLVRGDRVRRVMTIEAARRTVLELLDDAGFDEHYDAVMRWHGRPRSFGAVEALEDRDVSRLELAAAAPLRSARPAHARRAVQIADVDGLALFDQARQPSLF